MVFSIAFRTPTARKSTDRQCGQRADSILSASLLPFVTRTHAGRLLRSPHG